jgi:hypothetical protein
MKYVAIFIRVIHSFLVLQISWRSRFCFRIVWGRVQLGPFGTAATNRPIVPAPGDYDDGEKLVEWWLTGDTEVLGENLPQCRFVHSPTCSARKRTRAAAVGSQRLTALATARSHGSVTTFSSWTSFCLPPFDQSHWPSSVVQFWLQRHYTGGWNAFTLRVGCSSEQICWIWTPKYNFIYVCIADNV